MSKFSGQKSYLFSEIEEYVMWGEGKKRERTSFSSQIIAVNWCNVQQTSGRPVNFGNS